MDKLSCKICIFTLISGLFIMAGQPVQTRVFGASAPWTGYSWVWSNHRPKAGNWGI